MKGEEIPLIMNRVAGRRSWLALGLEKVLLQPPAVPRSAHWSTSALEHALLRTLEKKGFRVRVVFTEGPGDGKRIAEQLVQEKARLVVVAGGDGTINEVVNGIAGTETSLGIVPLGTANSYATELGLPFSFEESAELLLEGRVRTVDLGRVGKHFFAMGAGVSFDAHVIQNIRPAFKRLFGSLAFIMSGIRESLRYPFPLLEAESEVVSTEHEGYLVIVANARYYGGCFRVAPRARLDDGLLDVVIMKQKRLGHLLKYLWTARYGDLSQLPDVEYFQCHRVSVGSASPTLVHVDAEIAEQTPCEFECIPGALRVICPPA